MYLTCVSSKLCEFIFHKVLIYRQLNETALTIQDALPDRHTFPIRVCTHFQFSSRNTEYLYKKASGLLFPKEIEKQLQIFRPLPPWAGAPARLRGQASGGTQRCTVAQSQPVELDKPWRILMLIFTASNTNTNTIYVNTTETDTDTS